MKDEHKVSRDRKSWKRCYDCMFYKPDWNLCSYGNFWIDMPDQCPYYIPASRKPITNRWRRKKRRRKKR